MTLHRIRVCRCGHEEAVHDGNSCRYGVGISGAHRCECPKFRSRKALGKRSPDSLAKGALAGDPIGALKSAAEFLALAISLLERSAIISPKSLGKQVKKLLSGPVTSYKDFEKHFGDGTNIMTSEGGRVVAVDPVTKQILLTKPRVYGGDGVSKTSFKKKDNGERKILIVVAQHRNGVTREQISIITGYKTSTRNEYLSRLKKNGHVENDGINFYATASGRAFLGTDFKPLPTGKALREHWLRELPEGESAILELVCAAYPHAVTREDISSATAFAVSTRNEYLGRLVRRRLIDVPRNGNVTASKELF